MISGGSAAVGTGHGGKRRPGGPPPPGAEEHDSASAGRGGAAPGHGRRQHGSAGVPPRPRGEPTPRPAAPEPPSARRFADRQGGHAPADHVGLCMAQIGINATRRYSNGRLNLNPLYTQRTSNCKGGPSMMWTHTDSPRSARTSRNGSTTVRLPGPRTPEIIEVRQVPAFGPHQSPGGLGRGKRTPRSRQYAQSIAPTRRSSCARPRWPQTEGR